MSRRPAVSRSHGSLRTPAPAPQPPMLLALALAAAFSAAPAGAQPTGAQAIHGSASLAQQGNTLVVTTTNGAGTSHSAINWQSFSIPAGTTTRFVQPGATSTSINRVMGPDPSAILGTLSSNGRLVLVNPHGIAVGAGAVVDTAGFTASTLRMSDADAIAGRLRFGDGSAAGPLRVEGQVLARSGDVVLIAPDVQAGPQALVRSPEGATILAAGQKVELTGRGLEGIRLEVQAPADQAVNLGTLQGDAVGVFAGTLRHSGLVQASAVRLQGGRVVLKAADHAETSGTTQAQGLGGAGGQVDLLGRTVGVMAGAVIDTSNTAGGGQIRVGGDWQGKNPDVPNAQVAYVDRNATLLANASQQGDGGKVVVWADDTTRAYGRIQARGGAAGGNGGAIETSGKRFLDVEGARVDASAPVGRGGQWLLDPTNVTITKGGSDSNITAAPSFAPVSTTSDSFITMATLDNAINNATSVTISTTSARGSAGNITFDSSGGTIDIIKTSAASSTTLTLNADGDILFTGGGGTHLKSTSGTFNIVMNAAGGDIQTASQLQLSSTGVGNAVKVSVPSGKTWTNQGAGTVILNLNGEINLASGASFVNNGTVSGAGGNTGGISGSGVFNNTATGTVNFTQGRFQAATLTNSNDFTVGNGTSVTVGALTNNKDFTAGAGTDVTVTQSFATLSGQPFDFFGNNLSITQQSGDLILQGSGSISANGSVSLVANGGAVLSALDLAGAAVSVSATTDITVPDVDTGGTSSRRSGGPVQLSAGRDVTFSVIHTHGDTGGGAAPANAGDVQITAGGAVIGSDIQAYGGTTSTVGGDGGALTISAGGNVTLLSVAMYGGDGAVNANGGKGGAANITTGGQLLLSDFDSYGGSGSGSGNGGNGGNVFVRAAGGLLLGGNGRLDNSGGDGGSASGTNGGSGGNGGGISLNLGGTSYIDTDMRSAGGNGGSSTSGRGGNGGNGAPISISMSPGAYFIADPSSGSTSPGFHAGGGVGASGPGGTGANGATGSVTTAGGTIMVMASYDPATLGPSSGGDLASINIDAPWTNSSDVVLSPGAWVRVNGDAVNSGIIDVDAGAVLSLGVYDDVNDVFTPGGRTLQNNGIVRGTGTVQATVNNSGQSLLAAVATKLSGVPLNVVQQVITESNNGAISALPEDRSAEEDKKTGDVVVTDTSCKAS